MSRSAADPDGWVASSNDDRGQLVLVSGAVVAVALLALLVVHAQLGFAGVVETTEPPPLDDVVETTDGGVEMAAAGVAGRYDWAARDAAVEDFRSRLDPALANVERAHAGEGGVALRTNDSAAAGWALRNCPDGPYREFGPCVVDDGVVVQERAGETAVVAVLVDVRIATPRSRTALTVAVRPN
ncbi:DUF7261 family protein [Haloferax gibbonsii]|uniref:Uncharacterized protein n=1 Tax=Haloferax gibbonsii TaxID=35746 RepID=A0A0K1IQQ1_HALGI|nr:hypothetical protein [Haloferax gibbonsii]AKU06739.1 hypothetical protein ABY42_02900 [Haloferax gibbonsii]